MEGLKLQSKSSRVFRSRKSATLVWRSIMPLLADIEFVLADQFEELGVAQPIGGGFLQAHVQGLEQAGEAELFQGGLEGVHSGVGG